MNQLPGLGTGVSSDSFGAFGAAKKEKRAFSELARFIVDCRGTLCLLHVSGDVDISNSSALEAEIESASRAHRGAVVASFVDCKFADCSCLSALIRQFKLLPARLLIVAPPASRLRRLLDITCLTAALPVYDDVRAAQLAVSSDLGGPLGALPMWKSSEAKRARLDEMMLALQGSPRFQTDPARKFSLLRGIDDSGARPAVLGLGEPACSQKLQA